MATVCSAAGSPAENPPGLRYTMRTSRLTADPDGVAAAAKLLQAGGLVALPTETVYGLAADAENAAAVTSIFTAKGRPANQPVIIHVLPEHAQRYASTWSEPAALLADAFWPGPLTVVVPRSERALTQVTSGLQSVGLRCPAHPVMAAVLRAMGRGLAAPSANRYGHVSPTTAAHVLNDLDGRIHAVLDAGPCEVGLESTIVELLPGQPATLLRRGGIAIGALEEVLGGPLRDGVGGRVRAPGMVRSHYAPAAPVEVVSASELTRRISAGLAENVLVIAPDQVSHRLSVALGDDMAFAHGLYQALRMGDDPQVAQVLVCPPPSGPLLPAILDRLNRSSAPR